MGESNQEPHYFFFLFCVLAWITASQSLTSFGLFGMLFVRLLLLKPGFELIDKGY
jgi:hypothetical protein